MTMFHIPCTEHEFIIVPQSSSGLVIMQCKNCGALQPAAPHQPSTPPPSGKESVEHDPFIEKHLNIIMGKMLDAMIVTHIEKMWGGLEMASVQNFVENGKVNGSFNLRIKELAMTFAQGWHRVAAKAATPDSREEGKGTLEMLMGLVRYGWNSAAEQILNYCMENKVTESFENKIMELLDESNKQKFVYEIFQKHIPPPAPVSDAAEFAEWIRDNDYKESKRNGKWYQIPASITDDFSYYTTPALYTIFLTQKQKV